MKKFKPFKNMITDRDTKEFIGDKAIELLHKERLINLRNDLSIRAMLLQPTVLKTSLLPASPLLGTRLLT